MARKIIVEYNSMATVKSEIKVKDVCWSYQYRRRHEYEAVCLEIEELSNYYKAPCHSILWLV
ncbi:hypothetical protein GBA52_003662 [Prunus armeniaca]|nr:hypothetical protein GBA52_003662 [Prunus armeniaca]